MARLNLLPFPQQYTGTELTVHILVLPRNDGFDPLAPLVAGAPTFAAADLTFQARIISGLADFPNNGIDLDGGALTFTPLADRTSLYQAIATQFDIVPGATPPPTVNPNWYVRKHLPPSYRLSFNFLRPITDDAVIDDSYRCALRENTEPNPAFVPTTRQVSWGKALAYCLRHPMLSRRMGLIYEATLTVDPAWWPEGGYLYVDLGGDSAYRDAADNDATFLQYYAARIPNLADGARRVFAPVLFPVLTSNPPVPEGNYDQVFIEAGQYDDGFAKIVHANQPVSADPLREEPDAEEPPVYDQGIRLGWDDEQVLIWHNRQMRANPDVPGATRPLDAPQGVFGYRLDARREGEADWRSLVAVESKAPLQVGEHVLDLFTGELGVEVYPAQLDGYQQTSQFWLPQYFAGWNGQSLVLPDERAADIYQLHDDELPADGQKLALGRLYNPVGLEDIDLRYGETYEFRVRLMDITGGGPQSDEEPAYEAPAPVARCDFRRNVAPQQVRVHELPGIDERFTPADGVMRVDRPLLGYPAVVYTGHYADVYDQLREASENMAGQDAFGLPDPDVVRLEIAVEVASLKMDTVDSLSGRESFIHYYTTYRDFPADLAATLEIPLDWHDAGQLDFGDPLDPTKDILGQSLEAVDALATLPLPRARTVRLRLRALAEPNLGYFGETFFSEGRAMQLELREEAVVEENLFIDAAPATQLRGLYFQPDPLPVYDGNFKPLLFGRRVGRAPEDNLQRLAEQLGLERKGLSLIARPGERLRVGVARAIRHTLSPEHGSVTFAGRDELINHWIVAVQVELARDWTWDALADHSFTITRSMKFAGQPDATAIVREVGDIELMSSANRQELETPERSRTTLLFLDAVEPKSDSLPFPDEIELQYTLTPHYRDAGTTGEETWSAALRLPVVTNPAQTPKLLSTGLALSPYLRDERYSLSEPRRRYVWIELEEPIADPNDTLFARVLAYGPDPLLADIARTDIQLAPVESALPIPAEPIRVITPAQSADLAGLDAMVQLERAQDSDRHYLLPLPPGLNPDSPELFGFFTYEFRVGHVGVWSTAQGRFGRPLRVAGLQQPAPQLYCNVVRDEERLFVNAPYAAAMWRGRNVTSRPPRTEIWALLYAQVHQADGQDFRNILLAEERLQLIHRQRVFEPNLEVVAQVMTDELPVGVTGWPTEQILYLLRLRGLPVDSPLSVVCVEMMPRLSALVTPAAGAAPISEDGLRPLSDQLGHYRILRTSPLTPVPFVCCC